MLTCSSGEYKPTSHKNEIRAIFTTVTLIYFPTLWVSFLYVLYIVKYFCVGMIFVLIFFFAHVPVQMKINGKKN